VYGITRLGPRIGGAVPSCDVDAMSNIHTLIQVCSRFYSYRVYDHAANLLQDKYYKSEKTLPRLTRDPEVGRVMVTGGRAAVPGVDFNYASGQKGQVAWEQFRPLTPGESDDSSGSDAARGLGEAGRDKPPVSTDGGAKRRSFLGRILGGFRGR